MELVSSCTICTVASRLRDVRASRTSILPSKSAAPEVSRRKSDVLNSRTSRPASLHDVLLSRVSNRFCNSARWSVSVEAGVVRLTAAGAVSAWAVGMSSLSTTRVVGLAFLLLVLRRRRLTHHPHGTRSHGVGLVRKDISGGIRVMTSSRAGMAGRRGILEGGATGGLGGQQLSWGSSPLIQARCGTDRSWVLSYS